MLGSGSAGNATLLANRDARVLIDVGLSCRDVTRRLGEIGVGPERINAIIITHAHGDHTRGARVFARKHETPVYTTEAVRDEWGVADLPDWRLLIPNQPQQLSGLRFKALTIPHDASETVAFRIETMEGPIGFATDIGEMTPVLVDQFRDCRLLVIESNHATDLLRVSPYAASVRTRIGSTTGHLSNESLARFIRNDLGPAVRCIVLAHLSRVNNVPEIAELTCRQALADSGRIDVQVIVATQDRVAPTVDLGLWVHSTSAVSDQAQAVLPFDMVPNS